MKEILSRNIVINILISLLFAILSIFLIANPDSTVKIVTTILGVVIIVIGVVKLIMFMKSSEKDFLMNLNLFESVVAIILGISIIVFSGFVSALFRISIAIWIIYCAIERIYLSVYLKNASFNLWKIILVCGILVLICGIYILFNTGSIFSTIGIVMLIYSIFDIVENLIALSYFTR